jgi:hypothetical protein
MGPPPFSQDVGGRAFQEAVGKMWVRVEVPNLRSLGDSVKPIRRIFLSVLAYGNVLVIWLSQALLALILALNKGN